MHDTQVLIVGAGPTGLMLAAELARRKVRFRIIDKMLERSPHSRALAVHARSLELLQKLDLANELISAGKCTFSLAFHRQDGDPIRAELKDIGAEATPFPFVLIVSQRETERVLQEFVVAHGGAIEHKKELVGFEQHEEFVEAMTHDGETIRARFVVGCDGAHSVVRKTAGLRFEGDAYPQNFVLADVVADLDPAVVHFFIGPKGVLVGLSLKNDLFRLIATRAERAPDDDATLDEVRALSSELSGRDLKVRDPAWISRFRLHHRAVDRYRDRRVFVAGDAAHIHSPAGGQGMNTGLQDAFNLAWKLELSLHDRVKNEFLDSYHDERWPVGQFLLRFTDRLFSLATTKNPLVAWLRGAALPHAAKFVLSNEHTRGRAMRTISQLSIRYRDSAIVSEGPGVRGGPRAGDRMPDYGLFETLARPRHTLLTFGGDADEGRSGLYDAVAVSADQAEKLGISTGGAYLVRPDGHVAFRAGSGWRAELASYLAKHFS